MKAEPKVKAEAAAAAPKTYKVDPACPLKSAQVFEDYSATLNQTNVSGNNNKFYRVQLLCGIPPHHLSCC